MSHWRLVSRQPLKIPSSTAQKQVRNPKSTIKVCLYTFLFAKGTTSWLTTETQCGSGMFKGPLVAHCPQLSWLGHLSHDSLHLLISVPIWEEGGKILLLDCNHKNREGLHFLRLLPHSSDTYIQLPFSFQCKIHRDLIGVHTSSVFQTQYIWCSLFVHLVTIPTFRGVRHGVLKNNCVWSVLCCCSEIHETI